MAKNRKTKPAGAAKSRSKTPAGRSKKRETKLADSAAFVVSGRIRDTDDRPVAGVLVRAYDQDLRKSQLLGDDWTDELGHYRIPYRRTAFCRADKENADLYTVVVSADERELLRSSVLFNALAETRIDHVIAGVENRESEYEHVLKAIRPLLAGQGERGQDLPVTELTDKDILFLTQDTGVASEQIALLVKAHQSAATVRPDKTASTHRGRSDDQAVPAELYYGWFRQGVPTEPKALWSTKPDDLIAAFTAAIQRNIVPQRLREWLDKLSALVEAMNVSTALQPAADGHRASLGDLLATIPGRLSTKKERLAAGALLDTGLTEASFAGRLRDAGFSAGEIASVQVTRALGDLTGGNRTLVQELQALRGTTSDPSLRFLAPVPPARWLELAVKHRSDGPLGTSPEIHAEELERAVEAQHPTAVLAARIQSGHVELHDAALKAAAALLASNPELELQERNARAVVDRLEGVKDKERLVSNLQKIQRAQRLAGGWREAGLLLDKGLGTARTIVQLGPKAFQESVGPALSSERAAAIYAQAQRTHDTAVALIAMAYADRGAVLGFTAAGENEPDSPDTSNYPNLRRLFGNLTTCECEHCQSVLSPAAYLVDLLRFLDPQSDATRTVTPALSTLLARRPDIADIELTCRNTTQEVPYIDLVLEVLENAIGLPIEISAPYGFDPQADLALNPLPSRVMTALRSVLERSAISIDEPLRIERSARQLLIGTFTDWMITDGARYWTLRHFPRSLTLWRLGIIPKVLDVTDYEAVRLQLDQGQLPNVDWVIPSDGSSRDGNLPLTGTPAVTPVQAGVRWTVTYTRAVRVTFTMAAPMSAIILRSADGGRQLNAGQYPTAMAQMVFVGLRSGQIVEPLRSMLPEGLPYRIAQAGADWEITVADEVTLRFVPERLFIASLTYQTSDAREDALASPENRNPEAYNRLDGTVYPWTLPFNLWLEEVRTFLDRGGVSRRRLMERCKPATRLADYAIAREVLGLSLAEANIVTATNPRPQWEYWGLLENGNRIVDRNEEHLIASGSWTDVLNFNVSMLLQQSGLSYRELLNVLQTRFVRAVAPVLTPVGGECNPSAMRLPGLTAAHLDRIHRFVRLWKKTGGSPFELDLAIAATPVDRTSLNETALLRLSHLRQLHELLDLPVSDLAGWWGSLTESYDDFTAATRRPVKSLYERLFLNPAVANPPDHDFSLNDQRSEIAYQTPGTPPALASKAAAVTAALGIPRPDFDALVEHLLAQQELDDPPSLTLKNLGVLIRNVSMAKALRLSIADFIRLKRVTGIDPFSSPAQAITFVEQAQVIAKSGFPIETLQYLLQYALGDEPNPLLPVEWLSGTMASLREDLQFVQHDVAGADRPGETLAKVLAGLGWYDELVKEAVDLLGSSDRLTVTVPGNPAVVVPPALAGFVVYRRADGLLIGSPALSANQWNAFDLANAALPPARVAITLLRAKIDAFMVALPALAHRLQSFELPVFRVAYIQPPPAIPKNLSRRCYFDKGSKEIVFVGWMSDDQQAEFAAVLSLPVAAALKAKSDQYAETVPLNRFFPAESDIRALFAVDQAPETRVEQVLQRLLPYLRRKAAAESLAQALELDRTLVDGLLSTGLDRVSTLEALVDDEFANSDARVTPTPATFPRQARALCKLHKAALVYRTVKLRPDEVSWLPPAVLQSIAFDVPPLDAFPSATGDADVPYDAWRRLAQLFELRERPSVGSKLIARLHSLMAVDPATLVEVQADATAQIAYLAAGLDSSVDDLSWAGQTRLNLQWPADYQSAVRIAAVIAWLAKRTLASAMRVSADDVTDAMTKLNVAWPAELRNPLRLDDLLQLLSTVRKLGGKANECFALAEDTAPAPGVLARPGPSEAKVARGLLRARSEGHTWLQRLRPISDGLRHKQRDALVAYLIANPPANAVAKGLWKDANDLYEHFLIDPHMSACKVSTRILHAISAVQLFVQRCLMNLEDGVSPASINAERWRWMKNYRVWEANRKVFLYPENWIEPELRDDKSELFMELEGQLQQSEFDNERAEELLKVYLKQLEDISSLAVVGMYVDNEASEGEPEVRIHVLGRTRNRPSRFYYRRWVLTQRTNRWEPWEHVALEGVKSDHVLPFVMRGDVYVAWPEITQLAAEPGVGGATAPGAKWRVQMAWIRRTTRGWTDRLMGSDVFEHPWVYGKDENQTFTFRVRNSVPGSMDIDCYGAKREGELLYDAPSTADINPFRTFFLMIPSAPWITVAVSGVVYASYANGTVFRPLGNASVRVYVKLNGTPDEITTATNDVKWDEEHGLGLSGAPAYRSTVDTSTVTDANGNFTLTLSLAAWLYGSDLFGNHDVGYYRQSVLKTNPTFELSVSFGSAPSQSKSFPYKDSSSNEVYQHHSRLSFQQNFIIGIGGAAPGGDADRPVSIVPIRKFRIYAADDAEWLPLATPLPAPPSGALTYGSGFKFTGANQSSALTLSGAGGGNAATVWTGVSPSYSLLPAAPFESQAAEVVVYRDPQNSYFIRWENTNADPAGSQGRLQIVVNGHPRAGELRREVSIGGVPKLFELIQQTWQHAANFDIHTPGSSVDLDRSLPRPAIYFEPEQAHSPYAGYNTELFFHLPMLVAGFLSSNQRFADAQQWLHFIFDPTTEDAVNGNQRYWRYLPFRTQSMTTPIEELLALLGDSSVPATDGRKQQITAQIDVWSKNPFRPHAVARMRPLAYQINVVFKYLDNLIAWGDSLFRQYTTESVNEATQLYVLAAKLLGPRPQSIPRAGQPQPLTYRRANDRWDEFSNAWLELESNLPTGGRIAGSWGMSMHGDKGLSTISSVGSLYFCVPRNEKLAVYWDKVDERLFNIRHCRNIDGAEQPLPLFQPPIDPALLVRATAAGLDIGAVLAEAAAPIPYYRFGVVMGKAMDLCNEVRGLGGALLAALEKKDAEQLSRLRSNQEMDVLNLVSAVKEAQIAEANANIDALRQSEQAATARFTQYQRLLGNNSAQVPDDFGADVEQTSAVAVAKADSSSELTNLGLTQAELDQIGWSDTAMTYATVAGAFNTASGILFAFPDISAGTPFFQSKFGGTNLGYVANAIGSFFSILERNAVHQSSRSAAIGQYQRRQDEWVFQSRMALKEIQQIRRQIIASTIRADIAAKELDNHKKQIEQAEETDRFMRDKYTNQELYQWMTQQLSGVYFRAYQIAYDCAKRAERAFQFELGLRQSSYIQFGYWDSLKKGLLSGERLGQDLRRMDVAYLDQNKREYEITKHVSLLQLDPLALVVLRESGRCEFAVPEAWFDMDYPGHYMRRLKSVSVTIPCVVGPYATVSCTVTLLKSQIRHSNSLDGGYGRDAQQDDPRFSDLFGPMQSMVTSGGQSDSGMFETNLRDERYLPFEGAGAVSSWRLELPTDFKTFDHDSISDVILHLRYTAREGGEGLRAAAAGDLQTAVNEMVANEGGKGVTRLFSLRHEFPTEWQRFLNVAAEGTGDHKQALSFGPERFPFFLRDRFAAGKVKVSKVRLFSTFTRKPADDGALYLTPPGNAFDEHEDRIDLSARDEYGDALYGQRSFQQPKTVGTWTVLATAADFDALKNESGDVLLRDVFVCFELTIT